MTLQRTKHFKGTLDAEREKRLQDLPGWTWDPVADQWEKGFGELLRYVKRHGDARVPRSCAVDGYNLGDWVKAQRSTHFKGTSMLIAKNDSRVCPAGHGIPTRRGGRRASATCSGTSNATVTPVSRSPIRSTATSLVIGSITNAASTPEAPSPMTANTDSKTCPAGYGTHSCWPRDSGRVGRSSSI